MKRTPLTLIIVILFSAFTMVTTKKERDQSTPCCFVDIRDGLVAYYPFTGNADDYSGKGNHATATGGIELTTDRTGNAGKAYLFDGIDDCLQLRGTASLDPQRLSIALWFMMDGTGQMQLVGNNNSKDGFPTLYGTTLNYFAPGAHFMVRTPGTCSDYSNDPNEFVQASFNFVPGQWYCYAATYDGLTAKIYVDGVLLAEQDISFQTLAQCTGTTFKIGKWWDGDAIPFKGKIDEVRVYNRALSLDEVKMLCATCTDTAQPTIF